jgi:elongation factor P
MGQINTNAFKGGTKLLLDGDPYSIVSCDFVKPGKGQAFCRVKMRNLRNGRVLEKTFKSGESVEEADVMERSMLYSYTDGSQWHFMDEKSYEQVEVDDATIGEVGLYLKEDSLCEVLFFNGDAIGVSPPNFVVLKVVQCDPGVKGDTVSGGSKSVQLETGLDLKVPLFINTGDFLKIDTRTGEYVSRSKDDA